MPVERKPAGDMRRDFPATVFDWAYALLAVVCSSVAAEAGFGRVDLRRDTGDLAALGWLTAGLTGFLSLAVDLGLEAFLTRDVAPPASAFSGRETREGAFELPPLTPDFAVVPRGWFRWADFGLAREPPCAFPIADTNWPLFIELRPSISSSRAMSANRSRDSDFNSAVVIKFMLPLVSTSHCCLAGCHLALLIP